ncbi:DUF5713 family protein [Arachnia propionica]|uniref:Uncharacterized protein n=1 Tax=Arachnia propionica TaxID=1750 RepID=A0A3P1WRM1_9ACTN|nr:DUF5713 family protein [Arachnia propionica]RRD48596.1 hypothetical protein EII35_12130 [Arachnia propionica]
MQPSHPALTDHVFLADMVGDAYYPPHLVTKGQEILRELCVEIETTPPADLAGLYALTHAATERFNDLAEEFDEADSEIETVARESIGADMRFIAETYGFDDADGEELISPRDW